MNAIAAVTAAALLLGPSVAAAALPIDLEIATDEGAPPGSMQEWGRLLGGMDLARLRLRGRTGADEPAVSASGDGSSKRYRVVGLLNRRNELVLPGGRFTSGDRVKLKKFLEELPERTEEASIDRGAFGLPKQQFEALRADLAVVVGEPSHGKAVSDVVAALTRGMATPIDVSPQAQSAIATAQPLAMELQDLSRGTALAAALRHAGLAIVPKGERDQPVRLEVAPISAEGGNWPVGWKPEESPRKLAPAMHEIRSIEIEGYTLAQSLQALAAPFKAPIIIDQYILTQQEIDPAKIQVKVKRGKTYLRRVVDQILNQARLSGELRVDEAGNPFYWVTQFGDESPRATK